MREKIQTVYQKSVAFIALTVLGAYGSFAQSAGGIDQATSEVSSYIDPVANLIIAIGAVVGLIGGVRIYIKWQSGDQDTQKKSRVHNDLIQGCFRQVVEDLQDPGLVSRNGRTQNLTG